MIFDSPKIEKLRNRYAKVGVDRKPWIVLLDEMSHFEEERILLERLLEENPAKTCNDLLQKLLSDQQGQQIGAWFQLMLFDWLRQNDIGQVTHEPSIEGENPDFLVLSQKGQIVIEAKAIQEQAETILLSQREFQMRQTLSRIKMPYRLSYTVEYLVGEVDEGDILEKVTSWLCTCPENKFYYNDANGNLIVMRAIQSTAEYVGVDIIGLPSIRISGDNLKAPLGKKAAQHKQVRNEDYCFVIALFLADSDLSAEEVQEAWFGQAEVIIDTNTGGIVGQRTNRKGITFHGPYEIRHKTVSGLLVFKSVLDYYARRRYLRSWYIQNPYAKSPIDPWLFPAESRFLIVEQTQTSFKMGWRQDKSQLDQL